MNVARLGRVAVASGLAAAFVIGALGAYGCGSRTAIEPLLRFVEGGAPATTPEGGTPPSPDSAPADAGFDAPPRGDGRDATIAPLDAGLDARPITTACRSALEPGAPSPMSGYCSTQDNIAPTVAPKDPAGVWATQLDASYSPSEIVVDADGFLYVASCTTPEGEDYVECDTLVGLDPTGAVAWSHTFESGVGGLFLAKDGALHVESGLPRALYSFDRAGHPTRLGALPPNASFRAVASDGSLFSEAIDYEGTALDRVVKTTPAGDVIWSAPLACNDCLDSLTLAADDSAIVSLFQRVGDGGFEGSIVRFDPSGRRAWEHDFEAFVTDYPAVAADGSIRVALSQPVTETTSTTVLVSLSPAGDVLWRTDLEQDPEQTDDDPLVVTPGGTTILRSFTHLDAVDATGNVLWTKTLTCPNCAYAAAADPDGGLVVQLEDVERLDPRTGDVLWSGIVSPQVDGGTLYFGSTFVLGPPGVLVGASFGGVVFAARDP